VFIWWTEVKVCTHHCSSGVNRLRHLDEEKQSDELPEVLARRSCQRTDAAADWCSWVGCGLLLLSASSQQSPPRFWPASCSLPGWRTSCWASRSTWGGEVLTEETLGQRGAGRGTRASCTRGSAASATCWPCPLSMLCSWIWAGGSDTWM
jgi:hypothetical protein